MTDTQSLFDAMMTETKEDAAKRKLSLCRARIIRNFESAYDHCTEKILGLEDGVQVFSLY